MCPSSVRRPSTGYDSFDEFADHSTTNRQAFWFTPLLRPGSTIAICCWPEHQSLLPTSCNGSWTLQRELWAAQRSTTTAWHTCFTLSCIGSMWQIKSHTSLGWRCTSACMASTGLSVWAVHTGRSSCWTTASSFRQPPSTRSMVSTRYVRPSHLRYRWTNDMELVPKQFAWAGHANWLFSSYTEDISFWSVLGTLSTLEAFFCNNALYKLTFTCAI